MRWVLALCLLGTTAILQATSTEPTVGSRAPRPGAPHPASPLATAPRATKLEVGKRSAPVAPGTPRAEPNAPRESEPLPPSAAMLGRSSVARGVLVDEMGAPVPSGEIRGMSWSMGMCRSRLRHGLNGYARNGIFVFRYIPMPPWRLSPPREDGTFPRVKFTFTVVAPGFATEVFELEPEIAAALRRGDSVEGLAIVLQRGASVEGTVVGPDGKPAVGVEVGVVDDPLARWSERRTRQTTDDLGRYCLVDIDPRRTLWIHVRAKKRLVRPSPLEALHADAVTHRTVVLERTCEANVRFEIDATDLHLRMCVDNDSTHSVNEGQIRVMLDSGPHHCEFTDGNGEVVKLVRIWIEPHQREHYELVRIDTGK